jgi:sugar O-acyltransferase (sialic acid O-acetyltransferase NeuD family)
MAWMVSSTTWNRQREKRMDTGRAERVSRVMVLGAGGHAQVVADILLRAHEAGAIYKPIGFLDDDPALAGTVIMGLPVLGAITQLGEFDHDVVIVAIGDNRTRARIFRLVQERREQIVNAIHPATVLAPDVRLGEGVMICAGVVANTGTVIGDNVILNTGCTVDHHNCIGSHVHIAPGVHLGGDVTIGEGTMVGIGASVVPQRTVGAWSMVCAGSVVTKDIPACATAAGTPARVVRQSSENTRNAEKEGS